MSAGITTVAVAGHPGGQPCIAEDALWAALKVKQAFAERTGTNLYVLTQFGFNPQAVIRWCANLGQQGITLPVHAGLAGPTPLSKLIRYAMRCGIGASLRTLTARSGGLMNLANMAKVTATPDEMLVGLVQGLRTLPAECAGPATLLLVRGLCRDCEVDWAVREGTFALNAGDSGFTVIRLGSFDATV